MPDDSPGLVGQSLSSFDARTKWGSCIHPVLNQGRCGSCWAVATATVLSDRLCIATGGRTNVDVSSQFLLNCDRRSHGCYGGYPSSAFNFLQSYGAPSAGCVPYTGKVGYCRAACTSFGKEYKRFKCESGSAIRITSTSA